MATTYLGPGKKVLGVSPSYASVFQQAAKVKADSIELPLTKDYRQDIGQMIEAPIATRATSASSTCATRTTRPARS